MDRAVTLLIILFILSSCFKRGTVVVENHVHNVKLENISWDSYSFGSLMPGESISVEIKDEKNKFPKTGDLKFYMAGSGNRVYLRTVETYILNEGETIYITLTDSSEVVNPLVKRPVQ